MLEEERFAALIVVTRDFVGPVAAHEIAGGLHALDWWGQRYSVA